jgi:hypothetical protein
MTEDNQAQLQKKHEAWKRLNELISFAYEKYKLGLLENERHEVEEFLYHREYEEALTNLIAILEKHKIVVDYESGAKLKEAYERMKIPPPEYLGEGH